MKYKVRKRKKTFKTWYIFFIMIIILILISTSYSLWSSQLYINGTVSGEYVEPELPAEVVKPSGSEDRLSTNTSLKGGWLNVDVFSFVEDVYEGNNTVVTKIANGTQTWFTSTISPTFSFSIKNNSGYKCTDATVEVEEYDPGGTITPTTTDVNQLLSATVLENGDTVTLTAKITFVATKSTTVGSYVNYKIGFLCNGVRKYYNYKILVSA